LITVIAGVLGTPSIETIRIIFADLTQFSGICSFDQSIPFLFQPLDQICGTNRHVAHTILVVEQWAFRTSLYVCSAGAYP
jgi:hypothetical protein